MGKLTWTVEQDEFLISHHGKMLQSDLAKRLNKTIHGVRGRATLFKNVGRISVLNFVSWPIRKYGKEVVDSLCADFAVLGVRYCSKKYEMSLGHVHAVVSALGVKRNKKPIPKTNYFFDVSVLKCPTREFAYFLGYLWADGHIHKTRSCVGLDCAFEDVAHLLPHFYKFSSWYSVVRQRGKTPAGTIPKKIITMRHYNRELYDFLAANSYTSKSGDSAKMVLAFLPVEMRKHWWRGYFDGDGHISFECGVNFQKSGGHVSITSCYGQKWDFLNDLMRELDIKKYEINHLRTAKNGNRSRFIIRDTVSMRAFLDFIYTDYDMIGLGRKYYYYNRLCEYMTYKTAHQHLYPTRRAA